MLSREEIKLKKIINVIKQKWLKDTVLTTVLVAVIIAIFIAGNIYINKIRDMEIQFDAIEIYIEKESWQINYIPRSIEK